MKWKPENLQKAQNKNEDEEKERKNFYYGIFVEQWLLVLYGGVCGCRVHDFTMATLNLLVSL